MKSGALKRQITSILAILGLGAAWGTILGLWFVAPNLIDAHRLAPRTAGEWLVLVAFISAMSAVVGAEISPVAGALFTLWFLLWRRRPDGPWVGALFFAPCIAIAYVAAAALVEWWVANRSPLAMASEYMAPGIGIVTLLAVVGAIDRSVRTGKKRPDARPLLAGMVAAAALGAAVLPLRVHSAKALDVTSDAKPLTPRSQSVRDAVAPLLLVGIDSGNWEAIRPLVSAGKLPTFGRLIAEGAHGDVSALWPPYWSGPAWAAILTGHPREETGIYADLTGFAFGLPPFDVPLTSSVLLNPYLAVEWKLLDLGAIRVTPASRTVLARPPVWELLSRAGVRAGVDRMDFTHPPTGQAEVVISNHAGRDIWALAKVTAGTDLVAPPELEDDLLRPFSDRTPFDADGFRRILPSTGRTRSARVQFEIDAVKWAYDIDRRTVEAAIDLLHRRPDLEFFGVYLGGFDNVCHAMWQYRFPDAYGDDGPSADDIEEFGDVIDRYLTFVDDSLFRILTAYHHEPNVIIVSDHGHAASLAALDQPLWRGWHGPIGIFIAHGPGVLPTAEERRVSYFDIVPTIFALLGFEIPTGMHGVPLVRPKIESSS